MAFFSEQLRDLRQQGYEVHLANPPQPSELVARTVARSGVTFHPLPMAREISPRQDLRALLAMYRIIRSVRPDIVNYSTPKAALLGGLASVAARVPLRVYFIHGLRSETAATGRLAHLQPLLRWIERLTCACAHEVVCVSASNRDEAVALGLVPAHKIRVLGAGSPAGIPVERYASPDPVAVRAARAALGLDVQAPVVGFVARLAAQKGIEDLLLAWPSVLAQVPAARLLLVGEVDTANPLSERAATALREVQGMVQVPFEADMSRLYPLMSVLTLPSRHEGLGLVVLEAAAAGIPTVVSDASGVRDANIPGVTGLQVRTGDVNGLAQALVELLTDPALARTYGEQGQRWVREHFAEEKVWQLWNDFYQQAWEKRRVAGPRSRRRATLLGGAALAAFGLSLAGRLRRR
ncbi:glycosyltransferase family 4 protein (plasmid) [Deinococcus sp. KNUC1210]|nr:glycosyltransferase family 4 protein [Deinococcus sp. KNUC1210]ULH13919.1 glycosyltransferase family 4 protein [Deinococcus sp. KNUC1210]